MCVCCSIASSVTDDVASYLVQQYITQCSLTLFDSAWQSCLCHHVVEMSRHRVANFVLQTIITRIHTQQQVPVLTYVLTYLFTCLLTFLLIYFFT